MFEQSGWTDRTAGAPSLNGGSGNATVSISDVSIDATFTPIIAVTLPTGSASSPWGIVGGAWTQAAGVMSQTSVAPGDKKAVLTDQSYPTSSQITANVQVGTWSSTSDVARAGVGILTDPTTGHGYNLLFQGSNSVSFLDDQVAWGNTYSFDWNPGTSYWFQLADIQGTLYGKIWQDGTTEPSDWMFEQSGWTDRTAGAPSLNGGSGNTTVAFSDVSIDATFTPTIAATPPPGGVSSPWGIVGGDWVQTAGELSQASSASGDKKAVLTNQTYPADSQITAKVRVETWSSTSDVARAGVGILTDPTTGNGYNLLFRGSNSVSFLDDQVSWGNSYSFDWNPGTSYWFQLADIQGTLYGKIWQDGTTEPSAWMFEQSGWTDRTAGAPSLNGGSGNATVSFSDVSIDAPALVTSPIVGFPTPTQSPPTSTWTLTGGDWIDVGGMISQTSVAAGDKKAILTDRSYPINSSITARVEVISWSDSSDVARAGVGILTDPTSGHGYNLLFRGSNSVSFLDDQVSWGNSYSFDWNPGTWYWFKLVDIQGTLYGKIWQDGSTEPSAWMFEQSGWTDRTAGAPSLNGGAGNATVSFTDVSIGAPAPTGLPITGFSSLATPLLTPSWALNNSDRIDGSAMASQMSITGYDIKTVQINQSLTANSFHLDDQIPRGPRNNRFRSLLRGY
jgi:hypothetical protein